MPSLAAARAANTATKLQSPISVVVGGTNGIGAALAVKLAEYSSNPTIHIVGRNATAADKVISDMKAVNPEGTYEFHKCDATLLSQVHPLAQSLRASLPRITHLILTPGILTMQGRTHASPEEPNDVKMMLHYYSRFLFTRELLPSLEAAAKERGAGSSKVMTVLDAKRGSPNKIDWNDLDLQKGYSISSAASHCITMTDIALQRFAERHPTVIFTHAYPGLVDTNIISAPVPGILRGPLSLLARTVGATSSQCGDWLFSGMQRNVEQSEVGKARFIDNHGDDVKGKVLATEEQIDKIWKHTEDLVDKKPL